MALCPFEWREQVANITLCREGSVLTVYIIQSFQKFCVSPVCQILSPYHDSNMQIICGNPDLMFTVNYLQKILFAIYTMSYLHLINKVL